MIKTLLVIIATILLATINPSLLIIIIIGMVPTFILLIIIPSEFIALSTGCFNLCGVLPFAITAIKSNIPLEHVFFFILGSRNILIMYSAAVLGFLFAKMVSKIIISTICKHYANKKHGLLKKLEELIDIWGDEIYNFPVEKNQKHK